MEADLRKNEEEDRRRTQRKVRTKLQWQDEEDEFRGSEKLEKVEERICD